MYTARDVVGRQAARLADLRLQLLHTLYSYYYYSTRLTLTCPGEGIDRFVEQSIASMIPYTKSRGAPGPLFGHTGPDLAQCNSNTGRDLSFFF